jgi:hypothetical protein
MKTKAFRVLVALTLCVAVRAAAQTNHVGNTPTSIYVAVQKPVSIPAGELVTRSGTVYKNFHIEKSDPSGLTISYAPDNGGMGIAKVRLNDLPDELPTRYGYDPKKAADFDLEQRKAMWQFSQQLIANQKLEDEINSTNAEAFVQAKADATKLKAQQEADAAKQKREDELKEREIAAKEKAAEAAMIQVQNPPEQRIIIQQPY